MADTPNTENKNENHEIKAKIRKKSLGEKFIDTFMAEDLSTTLGHIWHNVIVPKTKDIMSSAFNTFLYGSPINRPISGNGGGTDYNALSKPQRSITSSMIATPNVDDIMLYSETDVINLFSALQEEIRVSGCVTMGFLYRYLHLPSDHTKENYGWYHLTQRSYTKSFDENGNPVYCPILPKAIWLNNVNRQ